MDMALEDTFNPYVLRPKACFNPCFDGYGSGREQFEIEESEEL